MVSIELRDDQRAVDRLRHASGPWGWENYSYDPLNNIRARWRNGFWMHMHYDANNRLSATIGNAARSYAFDANFKCANPAPGAGSRLFLKCLPVRSENWHPRPVEPSTCFFRNKQSVVRRSIHNAAKAFPP